MFRIGALIALVLVGSLVLGCEEDATETTSTGLALSFQNCISFNANVFVDNGFVGQYTSERAAFIEVPSGSHTLFVESNLVVHLGDTNFCWTRNFTVSEGQATVVTLDCHGAACPIDE